MFKKHCEITNNTSKMTYHPNINLPKCWLKLQLIVPSTILAVACILKIGVENFSKRGLQIFYPPLATHFKIKNRPCQEKSLATTKIKITHIKYYQPGNIEVLNVLLVTITLCYVCYSCFAYCTWSLATVATLAALATLATFATLATYICCTCYPSCNQYSFERFLSICSKTPPQPKATGVEPHSHTKRCASEFLWSWQAEWLVGACAIHTYVCRIS